MDGYLREDISYFGVRAFFWVSYVRDEAFLLCENGGSFGQSANSFFEEVLERLLSSRLLEDIFNELSVDLIIGTLFELTDFMHQGL